MANGLLRSEVAPEESDAAAAAAGAAAAAAAAREGSNDVAGMRAAAGGLAGRALLTGGADKPSPELVLPNGGMVGAPREG